MGKKEKVINSECEVIE